ncbi:MAG: hypothetical protein KAR87_01515 [Candidatus Aenigmarchaeota archaeon]|nr:hypothetical protein [Candidatus Aenigmarchaeota archaeon]
MELQNTNTDKLSGDNMEEKIAIKQEYDRKEKETASFIAVLTEKAVYFDEEKDKYILASKKQINELVKEAYKNQDYIKANELLESAKSTLGKDIKKELMEIASKSLRLDTKHYFMLVGQAYQKDMSLADVVRYKICDYLKENLKELEMNEGKKEMLERSLELWENKKSIKPKKSYDNFYNLENDKKFITGYVLYVKYLFKEECRKDGFSNEQIDFIMQYYGSNELYGEVELNLSKANKDRDIILTVDIEQTIFLDKWDILKEEFSNKFEESSLINLKKHIYEEDISNEEGTAAFDYSFYTPEFYLNLHPSLKINGLEFEYKNEKLLVEQLFGKLCTIEEKEVDAIKNKINENIKKDNYIEAKELGEQLAYYDSCKTISNKTIGLLFNYIKDKEIITFTIPKSILLWFNALGGDKKLSELIEN